MMDWQALPQFHYCWSNPEPSSDFDIHANKYFTPGNAALPFHVGGSACSNTIQSLADWQNKTKNDAGSTISADMDIKRAVAMARTMLTY